VNSAWLGGLGGITVFPRPKLFCSHFHMPYLLSFCCFSYSTGVKCGFLCERYQESALNGTARALVGFLHQWTACAWIRSEWLTNLSIWLAAESWVAEIVSNVISEPLYATPRRQRRYFLINCLSNGFIFTVVSGPKSPLPLPFTHDVPVP
jgi:hypothetical protein